MDRIQIRDFEPADVHDLVPMWRQSFEHGVGIVDPNPLDAQVAYFHDQVLPTHAVRVALRVDDVKYRWVATPTESAEDPAARR